MTRLTSTQLNEAFVAALGDRVVTVDDITSPELTLELDLPVPRLIRAYLFNATNPPGGRPSAEHKIQLHVPGQARDETANFNTADGRAVILAGKVEDADEWVLWDATLYKDFAAYANVQVKTATIEQVRAANRILVQQRKLRLGDEVVLVAPSHRLDEAILLRFSSNRDFAAAAAAWRAAAPPGAAKGGKTYVRPPRELSDTPSAIVFEVDPNLIDRGTTAHKDTQDALADALAARGLEPLSPEVGDPQFDVAWLRDDVAYVAEVKSLTDANEERQLRLGLGQVLSYVHLLDWPHATAVRGVLAIERPPTADYWATLCSEHGVTLTWPGAFDDLFVDGV